jgi:hypothetical protein
LNRPLLSQQMAEEDMTPTLHKLLIDAARTDNTEQLGEVFSKVEEFNVGKFDVNYQDGIGNTGAPR